MSSFGGVAGLSFPAGFGAAGYPIGATPTFNTQAAAAAACVVNLNGVAGKTTYMTGFIVTGLGATGATTVVMTIVNLIGAGTMSFDIAVPAGVTTAIPPIQINFAPGIPASGTNTVIQLTVPSFGTGNTQVHANIWGFQL